MYACVLFFFFLPLLYRIKSKANRYWFFIYNLLREHLECSESATTCNLSDFKAVEKCFGDGDIEMGATENDEHSIESTEVINVLKQFIESSNYGEFHQRMDILKSFEFYLHYLQLPSTDKEKKKMTLIAIIHNLYIYYSQFIVEINETIKSVRTPIEKKLKEFVKIESYNKDLSYFSMKSNITRVHRHLHKFRKEFETSLQNKISSVFQYNPNQNTSLTEDQNDKGKYLRHESRITYYMIDVKNFVASQRLKEYAQMEIPLIDPEKSKLLSKIDKLFGTSRNIVKQAVLHIHFPNLIYNLDTLVTEQIETCGYLRKLEVDRNQEKPKQKAQAKHILQQKRKALADAYKTLAALGLSFRAGILESSLNAELVCLDIRPFSIPVMLTDRLRHKKIDQNLHYLNENLNENYARCVFKLKLLQTVLLTPSAELGLQNLERIKGFSIDLFLLVQSQRKFLAKTVQNIHELQEKIDCITQLHQTIANGGHEANEYEAISCRISNIESNLTQIITVFEQYRLLLKCAPSEEDQSYSPILSIKALTKSSSKYQVIEAFAGKILENAKSLLAEIVKIRLIVFHSNIKVNRIAQGYNNIVQDIKQLMNQTQLNSDGNYLVMCKPLENLIENIEIKEISENLEFKHPTENFSYENIDTELENIIHNILLTMQSIYKKYSTTDEVPVEKTEGNEPTSHPVEDAKEETDNEETLDIQKDHLKLKINGELRSDLKSIHLPSILSKLSVIISTIRHKNNDNDMMMYAKKLVKILPILEQYTLLCKYYLTQQLGAHKISTKMLNVMLTVFIELGTKGFCIPPDLMQDDEDGEKKENEEEKGGEGFGLEDGTGEKDVSDQ